MWHERNRRRIKTPEQRRRFVLLCLFVTWGGDIAAEPQQASTGWRSTPGGGGGGGRRGAAPGGAGRVGAGGRAEVVVAQACCPACAQGRLSQVVRPGRQRERRAGTVLLNAALTVPWFPSAERVGGWLAGAFLQRPSNRSQPSRAISISSTHSDDLGGGGRGVGGCGSGGGAVWQW